MENKKYTFYSDAGHAWLAVKKQELINLHILSRVSRCSFERGQTVYLEEDCDAALFEDAYTRVKGVKPEYIEKVSRSDRSPIRSYDCFDGR